MITFTLTREQASMLDVIARWARGAAGEQARNGEHGPTHAVLAALVEAYAETFGTLVLSKAVSVTASDREEWPLAAWSIFLTQAKAHGAVIF
jgi:hypothetical protein